MDDHRISEVITQSPFKTTLILTLALNFLARGVALSQQKSEFNQLKEDIFRLWEGNRQAEAINLLKQSRINYVLEVQQHAITYYLGLLYLENGQLKESIQEFESGFKQGFFFSIWPNHRAVLETSSSGKAILAKNYSIQKEYQKTSKLQTKVLLPSDYHIERTYPLLYFFHGNNSSLDNLTAEWRDVHLDTEVIVVLAQSPYARSNHSYDWSENAQCYSAFETLHQQTTQNYSVDSTQVILSGFSNGGRFAINRFIGKDIDASGFLVFNPSTVKNKPKGVIIGRGIIITGEEDYFIDDQKELSKKLKENQLQLYFKILKGHGHNYPEDFERLINESINFLIAQ